MNKLKKCSNCGAEVQEGNNFCIKCGNSMNTPINNQNVS